MHSKALQLYPFIFRAQFNKDEWQGGITALDNCTAKDEEQLSPDEREQLYIRRSNAFNLPLLSATTLYGYSVFEGGKAFAQANGSVKLFRPLQNGERMAQSIKGLKMIAIKPEFVSKAMRQVIGHNARLGYKPLYQSEWEKNDFIDAKAIYIRPITYSSMGLWPSPDTNPYFIVSAIETGALFDPHKKTEIVVSSRTRAIAGGTGALKCTANYTISILAKQEAVEQGFSDALFLDAREGKYIEEGSVSNFFAVINGELVTPALTDTILPGITRQSIIQLAPTLGIKVSERPIELDEVLNRASEAFCCGTAAAITPISAITTTSGKRHQFGTGGWGELTKLLSKTYRAIQYGVLPDKLGWLSDSLI